MRARLGPGLLVLLALGLILGGCGSGAETSTGSAGEGAPRISPLKVSGGGSAQFHVKGGDNSIQNYGEEASPAELRRTARLVHGYLVALAEEGWAHACSYFSRKQRRGLERLAAGSTPKLAGCPGALAKLIGRVAPGAAREATVLDAASLRSQGPQGFLIYRGAGGKAYFMSLWREGGSWTVAALSPVMLS